jgi:hypothetical protein
MQHTTYSINSLKAVSQLGCKVVDMLAVQVSNRTSYQLRRSSLGLLYWLYHISTQSIISPSSDLCRYYWDDVHSERLIPQYSVWELLRDNDGGRTTKVKMTAFCAASSLISIKCHLVTAIIWTYPEWLFIFRQHAAGMSDKQRFWTRAMRQPHKEKYKPTKLLQTGRYEWSTGLTNDSIHTQVRTSAKRH